MDVRPNKKHQKHVGIEAGSNFHHTFNQVIHSFDIWVLYLHSKYTVQLCVCTWDLFLAFLSTDGPTSADTSVDGGTYMEYADDYVFSEVVMSMEKQPKPISSKRRSFSAHLGSSSALLPRSFGGADLPRLFGPRLGRDRLAGALVERRPVGPSASRTSGPFGASH